MDLDTGVLIALLYDDDLTVSLTEGIDLDRCTVGGLMMCLTKIVSHGLATILITYFGFIDN